MVSKTDPPLPQTKGLQFDRRFSGEGLFTACQTTLKIGRGHLLSTVQLTTQVKFVSSR
jgi:hypothetical protein